MGSVVNLSVNCVCGCPEAASAGGGQGLVVIEGGNLEAWRVSVLAGEWLAIICPACGCAHDLADGVTHIRVVDKGLPKITGLNVSSGPAAGGTIVLVTGHRLFAPDSVVKFGGAPGVNPRSRQGGQLVVDTPPHAAGIVDVTVENRFGQRQVGGKLVGAFTYT